jgi:hypothetical protein
VSPLERGFVGVVFGGDAVVETSETVGEVDAWEMAGLTASLRACSQVFSSSVVCARSRKFERS